MSSTEAVVFQFPAFAHVQIEIPDNRASVAGNLREPPVVALAVAGMKTPAA
jgi:hypothetical protein